MFPEGQTSQNVIFPKTGVQLDVLPPWESSPAGHL